MIFLVRFNSSTASSICQSKNARQTLGDKSICICNLQHSHSNSLLCCCSLGGCGETAEVGDDNRPDERENRTKCSEDWRVPLNPATDSSTISSHRLRFPLSIGPYASTVPGLHHFQHIAGSRTFYWSEYLALHRPNKRSCDRQE